MKPFFLAILSCVFFFVLTVDGQGVKENTAFVIQGHLTGAAGGKVTLINVKTNKRVSHSTIKKGRFELNGKLKSSQTILALKSQEVDLPLLLVVSPGDTLNISGSLKDFPIVDLKGNQQSVDMQQYQKEFIPILQKVKALNAKAAQLSSPKDSAAFAALKKEAEKLREEIKSTGLAFIQYHKDALASLFALLKGAQSFSPQEMGQLYHSLSDEVQQSDFGKMAGKAIQAKLVTAKGAEAPDFTLKNVDGKPVSLSSFKGKYVLIDFWASWCGPCRAENPRVVAAYQQFKDQKFTILGVSLDRNKDRWTDAIEQDHLNWTQVSDLKGWNSEAARLYNVVSIPSNFLLDPSGKIIAKNLRGQDLVRKLKEIFNK